MRRVLAVLPLAALFLAVAPNPASAATYTSSGVRCTKVGTSGADRLVGTSGRDVLCGLGGNDLLSGYGGDDVLDGGSGDDVLSASSGNDTLLGGLGNDRLAGDSGNDRVYGGSGGDRLSGGDGTDVLSGQDGGDGLSGGAGADKEYGGPGNDNLVGGTEGDVLRGDDGNDDLAGEGGSDNLDGGAGTNWCTVGSGDVQNRCVYDTAPPVVGGRSISPAVVDVTSADVPFTVKVHVTDDTGVTGVQLQFQEFDTGEVGPSVSGAHLVSGTVRDGVWQASGVARRFSAPARFDLTVIPRDRVGRDVTRSLPDVLDVRDATPDRGNAVLTGATLSTTTVDVRTADGRITTTARVTDDAAGVDPGGVLMCLSHLTADGTSLFRACDTAVLYAGNRLAGYWRATSVIPKGSSGGDWNVSVWVNDVLHDGRPNYWWGPDYWRWYTQQGYAREGNEHELVNGAFKVLGSTDNTAARVTFAKVSRSQVDTLPSDQTVTLDLHGVDAAGEGVTSVSAYFAIETPSGTGGDPTFPPVEASLVSGTLVDGWWRGTLVLPQGTPPGRYVLAQVIVEDRSHWRSYTTPHSPYAGESGQLTLTESQLSTTSGAPWDGVLTVVQNASG
ncbi:MAG TPA: calcium-binding protein [Mycobacteriales bacterium]|nr:calcium-binding protein [Mycobacteriales bacterium]